MKLSEIENNPAVWERCQDLVRQVLTNRRWRAGDLARELDVNVDLIRRWTRGERRIQIDDLVSIAKLGEISLDEWFGLKSSTGILQTQGDLQAFAELVSSSFVTKMGRLFGSESSSNIVERQLGEGPLAVEAADHVSAKALETIDKVIEKSHRQPATTRKRA